MIRRYITRLRVWLAGEEAVQRFVTGGGPLRDLYGIERPESYMRDVERVRAWARERMAAEIEGREPDLEAVDWRLWNSHRGHPSTEAP